MEKLGDLKPIGICGDESLVFYIKKGWKVHCFYSELKKNSVENLKILAEILGLANYEKLKKQNLIDLISLHIEIINNTIYKKN